MTYAKLRYLRISPRKVRLVADLVRGMGALKARHQLELLNKKAALPMLKLLNSALANAEHNDKIKAEDLYIAELRVDEGPTLKRWIPRARGSASGINKRTAHITLGLEKEGVVPGDVKEEDKKVKKDKSDKKDKKQDKDVKIVGSLEEVKTLENSQKIEEKDVADKSGKSDAAARQHEEFAKHSQQLDTPHQKQTGNKKKSVFRRKSV